MYRIIILTSPTTDSIETIYNYFKIKSMNNTKLLTIKTSMIKSNPVFQINIGMIMINMTCDKNQIREKFDILPM